MSATTRVFAWRLAAVLAAVAGAGCARHPAAPAECAQCASARLAGGWCELHEVGYVAGVRADSPMLIDVAHLHGHPLSEWELTCESCARAIETDGWCDRCGLGWVDGKAYVTVLAYQLSRGEPRDPESIECPVCRANARTLGWCDRCGVGMLGNVALADRAAYDQAAPRFEIFLDAVKYSSTCERCAAAMCTDGACYVHRVRFVNGRPVTDGAEPPLSHDQRTLTQ